MKFLNDDLISVIIPIYNVEKYLFRCLSSVISQTYYNLEIILINDGSTDSSEEICNFFCEKDNRIVYFKQENRGLAAARNLGIDKSTGKFVCFLDSDDWIHPKMYEHLLLLHKITCTDIISCRSIDVYNGTPNNIAVSDGDWIVYENEDAINALLDQNTVRFEVWNKLYLRSAIGNHRFINKQIYEDVFFERNIFMNVKKVCYLNCTYHYYLKEREGNTNSSFDSRKLDVYGEFENFRADLKISNFFNSVLNLDLYVLNFARSQYTIILKMKNNKNSIKDIKKIYNNYYDSIKFKNIKLSKKRRMGLLLLRYFPNFYKLFYV